jgi:hypothetical protein
MPGRERRSLLGALILMLVALTALVACSAPARPLGSAPAPSPSPVVPDQSDQASAAVAAGPPVAALAAEGGDPTDGQLGTYTWGDGGSDAPWLPGARMAVGAGEPLTITFRPETTIDTWFARAQPATADGPAGAATLGQGSGQPRFMAPGDGTWTVEVSVVFGNAAGKASYFWQLAVD